MSQVTAGTALGVAGLGAVGSLLRWLLAAALPSARLPWATLAVNVVGSLLIGAIVGALTARGAGDGRLRTLLTAGLLGGFTTYSSFALETTAMVERRAWGHAAGYVGATLVLGLVACGIGLWLGRTMGAR